MAKEGMGQEIKPGASAVALDPRADRKKSPKWVISWHNVSLGKGGNFRIWVSSFGEGVNARVVQGFHVERMGKTFRPISTTEYVARYDLLKFQDPSLEDGFITSEAIRRLGVGAILDVVAEPHLRGARLALFDALRSEKARRQARADRLASLANALAPFDLLNELRPALGIA